MIWPTSNSPAFNREKIKTRQSMRVHIYLWCNTNKANRIPWSSVCLRAPHGKCHGSSCILQGMMDWKSNDIFHSYLGNIILRNKISQDYISEKCLLPCNNGCINSLNNFTNPNMNTLYEVLWNEKITRFPRKTDFFYIVHSKHNKAVYKSIEKQWEIK